MRFGVPREIKNHEYRVGLTPASVRELAAHGHEVIVERSAGGGIGATDDDYRAAGATIAEAAAEVFAVQAGAYCLERAHGGMGTLLGGVPGVPSARIVVLCAGVVGTNAAQIAVGSGVQVVVVDRSLCAPNS